MTNPFRFKAEDFYVDNRSHPATIANDLLDKYLATLPRVYGYVSGNGDWVFLDTQITSSDYTHTALLFDKRQVEPIKRECVKHEPSGYMVSGDKTPICRYCNVRIEAVWTAVPTDAKER